MRSRLGHRKDCNHDKIKTVFEKCGWKTFDTYQLGGGFPDFIASKNYNTILVEVKDGNRPTIRCALTAPELEFHQKWKGSCFIIHTVDEALLISNRS